MASSLYNPMSDFDNPAIPLIQALQPGGKETITATKVLGLPALWNGVRLIAGKLGKIPCHFVKRGDGYNSIDPNHYGNWLLARPNPNFGKRTLFVVGTVRAMLEGNFFAEITWNDQAQAVQLDPLENNEVSVMSVNGEIAYRITDGNTERILDSSRVLHIKNLTRNPYIGLSAIDVLCDALGLSIGLQRYANKYFKRLANVGWIIETPQTPDETLKKETKESMKKFTLDSEEAFGLAMVGGGWKLSQVQLDAEKAQLVSAREFDLVTISQVLGCPPHKLGSGVNAGYKSLQEMEQAFYDDCISYWCDTWAEELELKILSTYQLNAGTHFVDWDASVLVKADIETQHKLDIDNLNNGIYTANQLNVMRNRPKSDDPTADWHRMPAQIVFTEQVAASKPTTDATPVTDTIDLNPNPDLQQETTDPGKPDVTQEDVQDDRYSKLLNVTLKRLNQRLKRAYDHAYKERQDVDIEGHVSVFLETLGEIGATEERIRAYISEAIKTPEVMNDEHRLQSTLQ